MIVLVKGTYQTRARHSVVLARLDFGSAPHRNPNGEEIGSPHLHIYREGFDDKWAILVPQDSFHDLEDPWRMLDDFFHFYNIVDPPISQCGVLT